MHIGQSDTSPNSPSSTFEVGFFIHLLCPFFSDNFGLRIIFSNGLQTSESTEGYGSTYCILLHIIMRKMCYFFNMQNFWLIWPNEINTPPGLISVMMIQSKTRVILTPYSNDCHDDYPYITMTTWATTLLTFSNCFPVFILDRIRNWCLIWLHRFFLDLRERMVRLKKFKCK